MIHEGMCHGGLLFVETYGFCGILLVFIVEKLYNESNSKNRKK